MKLFYVPFSWLYKWTHVSTTGIIFIVRASSVEQTLVSLCDSDVHFTAFSFVVKYPTEYTLPEIGSTVKAFPGILTTMGDQKEKEIEICHAIFGVQVSTGRLFGNLLQIVRPFRLKFHLLLS